MAWQDAGDFAGLPQGPSLVRLGTRHVLLVREGDRVFATQPLCPHKFTALEDGHLEDGCLVCPTHDAHFDPATGEPRGGDEWAGRLETYPCRIRDGRVQVAIE